jgi:hypothetical protein
MIVAAHSNTWIVGSNPTRGMDICVFTVFVLSCVGDGLATGLSPVQESYRLSTSYIISELILNGNRPDSLIYRRRKRRRRIIIRRRRRRRRRRMLGSTFINRERIFRR